MYYVWFIYLFHIVFRTHVSSCVRGGVVTPKFNLFILGCDIYCLELYEFIIINYEL
jgi:hypothetical protein